MNTRSNIAIIIGALSVVMLSGTVQARTPVGNEVFGVGLQLGDPTAITAKIMPSDVFAFQFFVGGGEWHNDYDGQHTNSFLTGIDFIFHPIMIYDGWKTCALNLALGFGPALGVHRYYYWDQRYNQWDHDEYHASLYLRFVTGVNLWFKKFPLETFIELTPAIRMINPDPIGFHFFWVAAGGRWYF